MRLELVHSLHHISVFWILSSSPPPPTRVWLALRKEGLPDPTVEIRKAQRSETGSGRVRPFGAFITCQSGRAGPYRPGQWRFSSFRLWFCPAGRLATWIDRPTEKSKRLFHVLDERNAKDRGNT